MDINRIRRYIEFRKAVWPYDGKDALDFAVTELGEVMDAWIRLNRPNYSRNNAKDTDVGLELGDVYMMLEIASFMLTGRSLDENLRLKWAMKGFDAGTLENNYLKNVIGDATAWEDKIREGSRRPTKPHVECWACKAEAEIGTEENPHPIPLKYHTCK